MTDIRDFITDRLHDDQALADHAVAEDSGLAARVRRGVSAIFTLLEDHEPDFSDEVCCRCSPSYRDDYSPVAGNVWPCLTVRTLAVTWDDHPDFDPAWHAETIED